MSSGAIRLSDAEREAAAADLAEHYALGRLTPEEHAERLDRIWAAKTRSELRPIFRDLPSPYSTFGASSRLLGERAGLHDHRDASPARRSVPTPLWAALGAVLVLAVIAKAPLLVLGIAALWFFVFRPRKRR